MVRRLDEYGSSIALVQYLFVMAAAFLSAFRMSTGCVRSRNGAFLCGLLVFGFFCMMIISESTMRYKYVIMPYVFVFAAEFVANRKRNDEERQRA